MLDDFIHLEKGAYPESSCAKLIEFFEANESFAYRGSTGDSFEGDLNDLELTLELTDVDCYWGLGRAVSQGIEGYKQKYPLIDTSIEKWAVDKNCQLMRYEPNDHYSHVHCENDGTSIYVRRVFAWMIYLNTIENGGGTHFLHQNRTAQPIAGDMYIWPAHWTHFHHGVNAPQDRKYIITGWVDYV